MIPQNASATTYIYVIYILANNFLISKKRFPMFSLFIIALALKIRESLSVLFIDSVPFMFIFIRCRFSQVCDNYWLHFIIYYEA